MRWLADNPRRRNGVLFVVGAAAAAFLVVVVFAIVTSASKSTEIRDQQQANSPLIENSNATLERIQNCTTPGRPCYERGQRQLARAVGDINRVVVLAASCASGTTPRTESQIQSCVIQRLSAERPPR